MAYQDNWRWCNKCQGMFFNGNPTQGVCPADGNAHNDSGSGNYILIQNSSTTPGQDNWRWCNKCQGMFFNGNPTQGVCPADGNAHNGSDSGNYILIQDSPSAPGQDNWRWCNKCQGLFFAGNPTQGVCPADGNAHNDSGSGDYVLVQKDDSIQLTANAQPNQTGWDMSWEGKGFPPGDTVKLLLIGLIGRDPIEVGIANPDSSGNFSGIYPNYLCSNQNASPDATLQAQDDVSGYVIVVSNPMYLWCW